MTADADRHLLFGLLALQNGLVNQGQFVAAFQEWTLDKSRSLADYLEARGHLSPAKRELLDALAEVHLEAHCGDIDQSLAAVSAGKSTRESLARIADPDLEATLTRVGSRSTNGDPDRTDSYSVGLSSSDGQRFRVLRPHARGGLGAVYVALDGELNREVALKQILDHHADDPVSRQRFLVEAEITGGLEHPGIVPVYGLGTYEGGRPYYAMRFIRGDSLKDAIESFHQPDRSAADAGARSLELRHLLRRFTDVCNAIDYAHSRGILHRDLKPGNVIVGRHGETLVVDWGLAKATGKAEPGGVERTLLPSSASGSAETLPGSAMGTPAYMSPEQAAGDLDQIGPRSDVYSLGATLYCLLIGKAPFEGDVFEVLRKVQKGDFTKPRQLDPSIDRALEAVCLKAMATLSEVRYPSCRALADDIERWTADEPVSAYREPIARRARRWAKRNRPAVTGVAVALVAGLVGLSAVLAVQTQANAALAIANSELTRSKGAVQDRYDLAVDAIKTFHTGVSEDFLLKQDQFKELRDRLLKSAAEFYGKLGALLGKETDVASRRALAQANFEVAVLTEAVGRKDDALKAHRAVLAGREALASGPASAPETKTDVGRSLTAVASLLESTGKTDLAEATYRKAEALLASLTRASPPAPDARAALAVCRSRLGTFLFATGKSADALAAYGMARAEQEVTAEAPGATNEARRDLADTHSRIGIVLRQTGKPTEAEAEYGKALALYQKLADDNPAVTAFRASLAGTHNNLAWLLAETGKSSRAEAEYRLALALKQKLADDNPAVTSFRSTLAATLNNLGMLLSDTGKPREAEAEYRNAVAIFQKLADDNPTATEFRNRLANSRSNLGSLFANTGKPSESEAETRKAVALFRRLADDNPDVTEFRNRLAISLDNLGIVLALMGNRSGAESQYRAAVAIQQKLADLNPGVTEFPSRLADTRNDLGSLLWHTGRPSAAEGEFRSALAINQRLADDNPTFTGYRHALASSHVNVADVLRNLGRNAEAREGYEKAIAIREALVKANPETVEYRSQLAASVRRRGLVRLVSGETEAAVADVRKAIGLYEGLPSRSAEDRYDLACCHAMLAGARTAGAGPLTGDGDSEADNAVGLLRLAVIDGFRNHDAMTRETALDPLRNRPDFRLLMMDLAMPVDPFARAGE